MTSKGEPDLYEQSKLARTLALIRAVREYQQGGVTRWTLAAAQRQEGRMDRRTGRNHSNG